MRCGHLAWVLVVAVAALVGCETGELTVEPTSVGGGDAALGGGGDGGAGAGGGSGGGTGGDAPAPDVGGSDPDAGPVDGDAGAAVSDAAPHSPDGATITSDGGPTGDAAPARPDADLPAPDAELPAPDAELPAPDAAAPAIDAAVPDLDAAAPDPDAAAPDLDAAVPPPDAGDPEPDAEVVLPVEGPLVPRVANATCAFPEVPPAGAMATSRAWPNLWFDRPIWLGHAGDGTGWMYVAEQGGRVYVFDADDAVDDRDQFLNLQVSRAGNEEGLLGLAFHPNYAENGRYFVHFSAANPRRSVIAELLRDPQNPRATDPESGRVLMEISQPFSNHNGGDMHFGPDGYLYIAVGDGGSGGDPRNHGQRPTTLLGTVLRIDVDAEDADCGLRYAIPPDNPFVDPEGGCEGVDGRPEVWAWGLRNPWRMRFDRATGELWAGDVGQGRFEEIDIIEGGRNYGWNVREGFECYNADECASEGLEPPILAYGRGDGASVTGGAVYRGPRLPELWGAYIYADFVSGRVWAARRGENGDPDDVTIDLLVDLRENVSSFGEDPEGRLYITTFAGTILRLERNNDDGPVPSLPARLSDTGCFEEVAAHTMAPGVVPYAVNSPLWSDGADKLRYFALPGDAVITVNDEGRFVLPTGAVAIKTFVSGGRRIETRFLVGRGDFWQGYTYRWNAEQTDADLVDGAGFTEAIDTPTGDLTWNYPSRGQCDACHTPASGQTLGLTVAQLNGAFPYPRGAANQLTALSEAGYLDLDVPAGDLPAYPDPADADAPVGDRARAYLEANCAMCHRPGGNANARIDLRAATAIAETGLCDTEPDQGDLGIADARLVAPGAPARSVLLERVARRGEDQMPPLATTRVDPTAAALLEAWIEAGADCPE